MPEFPIILFISLIIAWLSAWVGLFFYRKKNKSLANGEYISFKEAIDKLGEATQWFDQINWYNSSDWDLYRKEPTPFLYNREHLLRFVYRGLLSLYRDPRAIDTYELPRWRKFCEWDDNADIIFESKFRHSPQSLFVKKDELNYILENPDVWIEPRNVGCGGLVVDSNGTFDNSEQLNKG